MRVHIICRNWRDDRVLPRFVRYLVKHSGWSVGKEPSLAADINYLFAYFEKQRCPKIRGTTAAFMTHLESRKKAESAKAQLYLRVAGEVNVRITMNKAQAKALRREFGYYTTQIPLPLELARFTIPKRRNDIVKPVVGVSGYTYQSGRKGERMVARLAQSKLASKMILTASGRGWPVKTRRRTWDEMPRFYQGLDVFLCTSSVEGGPMTTLEALACGTPVVIPSGVGLHDELPDVLGIFRYPVGDYDKMEFQLRQALIAASGNRLDRGALREATKPHSVQAFCEGHRRAFEHYLYDKPKAGDLPNWQGNSGIYLVAFGRPARKSAKILLKGLKEHMPDTPIALCSDRPLSSEDILIKQPDRDIGGRIAKIRAYDLAPKKWRYIFYIDVDTECHADLSFYFKLLQSGWEYVICKEPHLHDLARNYARKYGKKDYSKTINALGTDEALMINGGVWAFRRCKRVKQFFDRWWHEWNGGEAGRDQGPWIRAMYAEPLRLFVLGSQWNTFPQYMAREKTAGLLHYPGRARRWKGAIKGRLDSKVAWAAVAPGDRK